MGEKLMFLLCFIVLLGMAETTFSATTLQYGFDGTLGSDVPSGLVDDTGSYTATIIAGSDPASTIKYGPANATYNPGGTSAHFTNNNWSNNAGDTFLIPNDGGIDFSSFDEFTVELFIYPESSGSGNTRRVFTEYIYAYMYLDGGNTLHAVRKWGGGSWNENWTHLTMSNFPHDSWSHVAMTWDADAAGDKFKLYVNGELTASAPGTATPTIDSTAGFAIGGYQREDNSTAQFFAGRIDEFRLSDVALEPSEFLGAAASISFETGASSNLESVSHTTLAVILRGDEEGQTYTVDYAVTGGTATNGVDYTLADGTLQFDPGVRSQQIEITIADDGEDEEDETLEVTLSNPTGGARLGSVTKHIYTILDPRVSVYFTSASSSGQEDVTPANIEVRLSAASSEAVTVDYSVTGGTATNGVDYTLADGTLQLEPGIVSRNISISIVSDQQNESPETIVLTLSNPAHAKLGDIKQHTYTIIEKGTIYYVDSATGNDTNSGLDSSSPWKSLSKVNAMTFLPGDRILFKAGSRYTGVLKPKGCGVEGGPIVIDMYGEGDKPRIDGGGIYATVLLENTEYWEINNLEITNTTSVRGKYKGVAIKIENFGPAHHIHLKNLYIHDVYGSNSKSTLSRGIHCRNEGSTRTRFDDLLIENCHLLRTDRDGIVIESGFRHRDNWYPNLNVVIRNNRLEDIGGDGIVVWGCDGCVIEYNVLNGGRQRATDYAAGIWPWCSDNTVIQFNEVCNVKGTKDGQGFDSDYNCQNSLFQYNYSHDNEGGFMLIVNDGSAGAPRYIGNIGTVVRYNISQNDGARIFHIGGTNRDTKIYNNTFYVGEHLNIWAVLIQSWYGYPRDTYFYNNIFYVDGQVNYDLGQSTNTVFENNIFYGNHNNRPFDPQGITANPLLLNPGGGGNGRDTVDGYKLQAGSPAISSGRIIVGNGGRDYWGNYVPVDSPCTRGAYEWVVPKPCSLYPDAVVDSQDLRVFVKNWLGSGAPEGDSIADFNGDDKVNFIDFAILASQWLEACG